MGRGPCISLQCGANLEMADALWEGHTLLKTGLRAQRHTHRHTKVKTVYPPVSLRSLGGYKEERCGYLWNHSRYATRLKRIGAGGGAG